MLTSQKNNLPKMKADTGFSLGFFFGAVLGAVGVYLLATPQGRKLKAELEEEYKKHQQNFVLETVVPNTEDEPIPESPWASRIRTLIQKARLAIKPSLSKTHKPSPVSSTKKKHVFKQK